MRATTTVALIGAAAMAMIGAANAGTDRDLIESIYADDDPELVMMGPGSLESAWGCTASQEQLIEDFYADDDPGLVRMGPGTLQSEFGNDMSTEELIEAIYAEDGAELATIGPGSLHSQFGGRSGENVEC